MRGLGALQEAEKCLTRSPHGLTQPWRLSGTASRGHIEELCVAVPPFWSLSLHTPKHPQLLQRGYQGNISAQCFTDLLSMNII